VQHTEKPTEGAEGGEAGLSTPTKDAAAAGASASKKRKSMSPSLNSAAKKKKIAELQETVSDCTH
jgi:hypothetical protein